MLIALIVVAANTLTVMRLFCYHRNKARFRPVISLLAWSLMVCAFAQSVDIVLNQIPVTSWQAGYSVAVALVVLRARGNVASIVQRVS